MSIFGKIFDKVFHHDKAPSAPVATAPAPAASAPAASAAPMPMPMPTETVAAPQSTQQVPFDVGAVLETMASMKEDKGGNYQTSIVDLLKLLDLDSSLTARKELGEELGVHAGADGSAEQNIALHRAVMDKLADNGGIVPDSLRH